jgi:hypothetical protein
MYLDEREHLLYLIKWIYAEVIRSGGDGDALWYSKYYDVNDLFILIKEFNDTLRFKWEVNLDNHRITWGHGQEWIIVTNDKCLFENRPDWQQLTIIN